MLSLFPLNNTDKGLTSPIVGLIGTLSIVCDIDMIAICFYAIRTIIKLTKLFE